jgi:hypothetical protein
MESKMNRFSIKYTNLRNVEITHNKEEWSLIITELTNAKYFKYVCNENLDDVIKQIYSKDDILHESIGRTFLFDPETLYESGLDEAFKDHFSLFENWGVPAKKLIDDYEEHINLMEASLEFQCDGKWFKYAEQFIELFNRVCKEVGIAEKLLFDYGSNDTFCIFVSDEQRHILEMSGFLKK